MIINHEAHNIALNKAQQNPNDEYYTSKEEVDYVMSRLVKVLPKKTLGVFPCDPDGSEFVKGGKAHHLKSMIYDIDMFGAPAIAKLRSANYDKIIFVTNPPFSLLKYGMPLLNYLVRDIPDKFCYFLLVPLTIITDRFSRPFFNAPDHFPRQYVYPGKSLFFNNVTKKGVDMSLVTFITDLNLDEFIPEPKLKKDYLADKPAEIELPSYTFRYARTFAKQGYKLKSFEVRSDKKQFVHLLGERVGNSI